MMKMNSIMTPTTTNCPNAAVSGLMTIPVYLTITAIMMAMSLSRSASKRSFFCLCLQPLSVHSGSVRLHGGGIAAKTVAGHCASAIVYRGEEVILKVYLLVVYQIRGVWSDAVQGVFSTLEKAQAAFPGEYIQRSPVFWEHGADPEAGIIEYELDTHIKPNLDRIHV
jgi:hypothetical protein